MSDIQHVPRFWQRLGDNVLVPIGKYNMHVAKCNPMMIRIQKIIFFFSLHKPK